jgi:hypothetical protein
LCKRFNRSRIANVKLLDKHAAVRGFGDRLKIIGRVRIPASCNDFRTIRGVLANKLETDTSI